METTTNTATGPTGADNNGNPQPPKESWFKKFLKMVDAKFLNPTMLTTLITALIAPVVIVQVNRYIQNKAIQQSVITTVLAHANGEDFSKVQALEKIHVIASFVDENEDIFGLRFDSTLKSIETMKKSGYTSLSTELEENKIQINDLNKALVKDSAAIKISKEQIDKLERDKKELVAIQQREKGMTAKQTRELSNRIAEKEREIETRKTQLDELKERSNADARELARLKENQRTLSENLKTAEENLKKLYDEKDILNSQLDDNKKLLAKESQSNKELKDALLKTNEEWQNTLKDKEALGREINNTKFENSKIAKDLAVAQAEVTRLQTLLAELQKNQATAQLQNETKPNVP